MVRKLQVDNQRPTEFLPLLTECLHSAGFSRKPLPHTPSWPLPADPLHTTLHLSVPLSF